MRASNVFASASGQANSPYLTFYNLRVYRPHCMLMIRMLCRLRRDEYTVGWICALPVELAAAQEMLDEEHDDLDRDENDENLYSLGSIGGHNVVIVCLPAGRIGNNPAAAVATQMRATFKGIRFGLMVGIGGGVPSAEVDVRLGDVVVSQPDRISGGVVQYDLGKATPSGFDRTGSLNSPPRILLGAVAKVRANELRGVNRFSEYFSQLSRMPKFQRDNVGPDVLFEAAYDHEGGQTCRLCKRERGVDRQRRESEEVVVHYGTIASGNQVMRDGRTRDRVSRELGGVLCFEMEAAGLMNSFPCLVIRGICDYADSHKNKTWQAFAAAAAAAYAKEVLLVIPTAEIEKSRIADEIIKEKDTLDSILNRLPYAENAPFNSYARQHEPTCLPDTRVDVLREIHEWADGQDERCIFWLNGLAGTGKSTIAHTVARTYSEHSRLGASFFFSRGGGDISHAGKFFTTVAVQLARNVPTLSRHICEAITEHSNIASQSLRDQWHQLVLRPLSKLDGSSSQSLYVLVVDALDECDDENNIQIILQLLAEARSLEKVQLRVFMTSRPEIPIRCGFRHIPDTEHQDFVLHSISPSIVNRDIRIFLEYDLRLIGQERSLGPGWPGEDTIRRLVQLASGLFIWAATTCRFIREGRRFAVKRLDTILNVSGSDVIAPEKQLNQIYITVLKHSVSAEYTDEEKEESYCMLKQILGSIAVFFSPLSAYSLSKLLSVSKEDINQTLEDLHSVLDISKDQTRPLRLHHPSFRDFLLNSDRCNDPNFWVDEKQVHQALADSCIRLMSTSLKQDICSLNTPCVLITDIESSRVERSLPPEVQYACLYWIQHLQKSSAQLGDNDQVHQFLQKHLLHWFEALGWMRKVSEGIHAITSLESITTAYNCPRVVEFVHDAKRFVLYNRPAIEQAPLQTYCSALVFAPQMSIVRKQFKDCIPQWIRRLPKVENNWNALLQTLEGHSSYVNAVAFSPDGKLLASASDDSTVKLWDAGSGTVLQTLEGHSGSVYAVAFSPDSKLLVSASGDRTVKLWDAGSGVVLRTLKGHSDSVSTVAFSLDGKLLVSASGDRTVKLWDASSGAVLQTLEGHSDYIRAVAFSPDSKLLASASDDSIIKLWDAGSGVVLQTLEGHSSSISAVVFSLDGKLLVSACGDSTVKLWDASSGAVLQTLEGHSNYVSAVAFSPNGKLLASASDDSTVRLWDADSGAVLQTLESHPNYVNDVAFSPDSKLLASACSDSTVKLWDAGSGVVLQTLEGHPGSINTVAFSPDSKMLASASNDRTVKLWDAGSGAVLQTLGGHSDYISVVAFSPDGKLLVSASGDRTVKLWDASLGAVLQTLKGHSDSVSAVAFSLDSKLLASASYDSTVKLWDAGSGAVLQTLEGHSGYVSGVAFSPDGKLLASASHDSTVKLWDAGSGAVLQTLEGSDYVSAVAFSPNGKLLASASYDGTVKLWDAGTGTVLQMLEGHSGDISAVAFSPDGKLLVSASGDSTIKLWDASSGAILQTLEGHSSYVNAVAFSPDGKLLASASGDSTIKLWDAGSGTVLQTLERHLSSISVIAFSPDGKLLASASHRTVKLWDAGSGAVLQMLEGHSGYVGVVAFSPDGKLLASGSDGGTVKLWDAGSGAVLQTLEAYFTVIAFSPDSKLLASASYDNTVKLWDTSSGVVLQTLEDHSGSVYTVWGHSGFVDAVAFSPNGKLLASASDDSTVKLRDVGSGAVLQTLKGHSSSIHTVAFSPDGKLLAGAGDSIVRLWDAGSGVVLQTLEGHSSSISAMAFSPDGKLLASASYDSNVKLWDASSGAVLQTLEVDAIIQTLSFSNDGTFLQTNRGSLYTTFRSDSAAVSQPNLPRSVFIKEQWVSRGMENTLWLPSEHRPSHVAVHGSIIGFGYPSGRVTFMEFAF